MVFSSSTRSSGSGGSRMRTRFSDAAEIGVITACGNYSAVEVTDGSRVFLRRSLNDWEASLSPKFFMRVHRARIVNLIRITRCDRDRDEHTWLSVEGVSSPVPVSRYRWGQLRARFEQTPLDRVYLRAGLRARFVRLADISLITAHGNYSDVRMADGSRIFLRKNLKDWEALLSSAHFMRVRRTHIVNFACVVRCERGETGVTLILAGAGIVPVSRGHRDELDAWLRAGAATTERSGRVIPSGHAFAFGSSVA